MILQAFDSLDAYKCLIFEKIGQKVSAFHFLYVYLHGQLCLVILKLEKSITTEEAVQLYILYCLDSLRSINVEEVLALIVARKYFVLHAPFYEVQ